MFTTSCKQFLSWVISSWVLLLGRLGLLTGRAAVCAAGPLVEGTTSSCVCAAFLHGSCFQQLAGCAAAARTSLLLDKHLHCIYRVVHAECLRRHVRIKFFNQAISPCSETVSRDCSMRAVVLFSGTRASNSSTVRTCAHLLCGAERSHCI